MDVFVKDYIPDAIPELIESLNLAESISKDDQVLIKPNFCAYLKPGVTTDLDILRKIIEEIKLITPNVVLGETDSWGKKIERVFKDLDVGCDLVNLSEGDGITIQGPFGKASIPKLALESKIINVPIFKTHTLTSVTFGIKNLFGLTQSGDKGQYHYAMDSLLISLLDHIRPVANIMDGTLCMDGCGPMGGNVRKEGFVAASKDVIALDMACCELIGLDPLEVVHVRDAAKKHGTKYRIVNESTVGFPMEFDVPRRGIAEKVEEEILKYKVVRRVLDNDLVSDVAVGVKDFFKKRGL